jgi:hypothetical protein
MDGEYFDSLTRTLSSRRTVLGGLLAGTAAALFSRQDAAAHNPVPACRRIRNAKRRAACLRRARTHNRQHQCQPTAPAVICRGLCGTAVNNCNQAVSCPCPAGKSCLSNGSCAQNCSVAQPACPAGCTCLGPEVGSGDHCIQAGLSCNVLPQVCASTADCPAGSFCIEEACLGPGGFEHRCIPLCPS